MNKYYAIYIEKDIRLVIPWYKPDPPELIDVARTLSFVWGRVRTDLSFGPAIEIEEVNVHTKKKEEV